MRGKDCSIKPYNATGTVEQGCDPTSGVPPCGFPIHAELYHDGKKVAEGMVNVSCAAQDIRSLRGSPRPPKRSKRK